MCLRGDKPASFVYPSAAVIESTGLLLCSGELSPDDVANSLHDQGGPAWDRTVFRLLSGVDVGALAAVRPQAGGGTAVSVASSGWWLRSLDDVAERLAKRSGRPVLAVFESVDPPASGWHLARPNEQPIRVVETGGLGGWRGGVSALTGDDPGTVGRLAHIALAVHGEAPDGSDLPGLFNLSLRPEQRDEWLALLDVRGSALVRGCEWRPLDRPPVADEPPLRMRSVLMQSAVRLPGPPRWARATRAIAIRAAEAAVRGDGWICLVPTLGGEPAVYGTAVQVLQVAPLGDGSSMGVLHPRFAVRVGGVEGDFASVDILYPGSRSSSADELHAQLSLVLDRLRARRIDLGISEVELRTSSDPAAMLAWRLRLDADACQSYLAARTSVARLAVLADALVVR